MNINFQDLNQNKVNALKLLEISLFLGFLKQSKKDGKLKSNDIENELSKQIESNIAKLGYIIIKNYKNNLELLREFKKLQLFREEEINEIKMQQR